MIGKQIGTLLFLLKRSSGKKNRCYLNVSESVFGVGLAKTIIRKVL